MSIVGRFPPRKSKQIPAKIGFNATAGDNTLHLKTQANGFDCTIYWGDGTSTKAPVSGGNVIHSYATAGVYNIRIYGKSFAGFNAGSQFGKEKYVAAYSMGQWAVDTMNMCASAFRGCGNLTIITPDLFRYNTKVYDFNSCFDSCHSLTTIPPDLFRYNTAVENFGYCFNSCHGLTTIPPDLFRYNTAVMRLDGCFSWCDSLTTIPPDLFRYNTAVENFGYCLYYCTKLTLRIDIFGTDYANRFNGKAVDFRNAFRRDYFTGTQGTAPELWRFARLTAAKSSCFGDAGNSTVSLSNYNSIPADWIN